MTNLWRASVGTKIMRKCLCFFLLVAIGFAMPGCAPDPEKVGGEFGMRLNELPIAKKADTIFVVVQDEFTTFCTYYAYTKSFGVWTEEFVTEGYVGRSGVLSDPSTRRAGDGTTPGGIYSLGERFGINDRPSGLKGQYTKVTEDDYWNGDSSMDSYNQHVKGSEMPDSWHPSSSEHLIDYTYAYNYAAMINFNVNPAIPGKGSCIFLHCMYPGSSSSSGCVAIPEDKMIESLKLMAKKDGYIVILRSADEFDDYVE